MLAISPLSLLRRPAALLLRGLCALAAFALLAPAAQAAGAPDWTRTITPGPNGSFILGNPAAKTTLVEYFSYTCPHCADFAKEGMPPIKQGWVRSGVMKVELRNFIRDSFDLVAALLARCGGPSRFLANHDAIFAGYDQWMDGAMAFARSKGNEESGGDRTAQFIEIADKSGLMALLAKQGVTPAAQRACLADKTSVATILGLTAGAWDVVPNFPGTPTFLLNGKHVENAFNWAALKPRMPALPASAK